MAGLDTGGEEYDVPEICVVGNPTTWKLIFLQIMVSLQFSYNYLAAGITLDAGHWENIIAT